MGVPRCAALLAAVLLLTARGTRPPCLDSAFREEERVNLRVDGVEVPLGFWALEWDSSMLVTQVALIFAREVLGYNASITGSGTASATGVRATAGCADPNEETCDGPHPQFRHHASVEVWEVASARAVLDSLRRLGSGGAAAVPENVGSVGYNASEGLYVVPPSALENGTQVPACGDRRPESYGFYNASLCNASAYFDRYTDFDMSEIRGCQVNPMHDTLDCEGAWWFSPACSATPQDCIPTITGGSGWWRDELMRRASLYNMPIALAVANSQAAYIDLVRRHRALFYWWQPDSKFVDLAPAQVDFPEPAEEVLVSKFVDGRLEQHARRAHDFLSLMAINGTELSAMLVELVQELGPEHTSDLANTGSYEDIACRWLRRSRDVWAAWVPVVQCDEGMGMVSHDRHFLPDRSRAAGCDWCPAGWRSVAFTDELGSTYICEACPAGTGGAACSECAPGSYASGAGFVACEACAAGTYQPRAGQDTCIACSPGTYSSQSGLSSCEPCAPGEHQANPGQEACLACVAGAYGGGSGLTACDPCPIGTHQQSMGQSSCVQCAPMSTTDFTGATSALNCTCPADSHMDLNGTECIADVEDVSRAGKVRPWVLACVASGLLTLLFR